MLKRIALCILCLLLCVTPAFAADAEQEALARVWQSVQPKPEDQPVYLTEPSSAVPYVIADASIPGKRPALSEFSAAAGRSGTGEPVGASVRAGAVWCSAAGGQ